MKSKPISFIAKTILMIFIFFVHIHGLEVVKTAGASESLQSIQSQEEVIKKKIKNLSEKPCSVGPCARPQGAMLQFPDRS